MTGRSSIADAAPCGEPLRLAKQIFAALPSTKSVPLRRVPAFSWSPQICEYSDHRAHRMVTEAEGRSSSPASRCSAWHPCPWSGWNAVLKKRSTRRAGFCVALFCWLWLPGPYALALNPALDVSQYAHSAWRGREGFVSGHIYALAQTPDGYLWLGTDRGLLRFDGVRTTRWQPPTDASLPDTRILNLLVGRDGALWIGTWHGLA